MKADMSPKAVKGRLKLVSQLWRLSVSLGKAKKETDTRRNVEKLSKDNDINVQRKVI
jgi:hypothetical protein